MYYFKLFVDILSTPVVSALIDLGLRYLAGSSKSPMQKEAINIVRSHYRAEIDGKETK